MSIESKVNIDRRLCIGQIILGFMSHYDAEEVVKYPSIQYVAKVLKAKHFNLRNGTPKERYEANPQKCMQLIAKTKDMKKRQQIAQAQVKAVESKEYKEYSWGVHAVLADNAWLATAKHFDESNAITVSASILALLRKEPTVMKFYGFNQKKLEKYSKSSEFSNVHIFSSSRIATKLLEKLSEEIATHNYNQSKEVV